MKEIFHSANLEKLSDKCKSAERIAIISHTNPDGDAVGSGLALLLFLRDKYTNKKVRFFVPNHFPEFLSWVDPDRNVEVFCEAYGEGTAFLAAADLIFVVDFNQTSRLDKMSTALENNIHATRVLIDHHIDPAPYDITFHCVKSSSSAYLIYSLIVNWDGIDAITRPIAEALYLGMMTDTGCFSYGNLGAGLFQAIAVLIEKGVDPVAVNRAVYNQQSQERLRMVGHLINDKLVVVQNKKAAYITLTLEEKMHFNHQIGDTEGIVNIPLTIKDIEFSAILVENNDHVKISLRSAGKLDVNMLSNRHFHGGGHRNAAGGKFIGTMAEAENKMNEVINSLEF